MSRLLFISLRTLKRKLFHLLVPLIIYSIIVALSLLVPGSTLAQSDEEDDDNDKCSNKIGSAGMGFPYEKKTECEKQEWDECRDDRDNGIKWDDRCKEPNEGFFDDCEGYANMEECDEAWYTPPICDLDTPPGELCRDEGDMDQSYLRN
ncbi:MAG: hypothetical protein WBW34_07080 [Nitrososphaeraceae archaeon]